MKLQLKNIGSLLLLLLFFAFAISSCESETWREHYSVDSSIVSDKDVWETIKSNPELSKFASAIEKTGYDKFLSSSQMITVWAPTNSQIDESNLNMDNELLLKQFVQNHIARFSYTASGNKDLRILLMNGKQLDFKSIAGTFYIGDIPLLESNIAANNGVVHTLSKPIPFFGNIWEYIMAGNQLDSIRTLLLDNNVIIFDEENSIPGDVNEFGEIVYLDSVLINYNPILNLIGQINNEDSTYTMLVPTNEAWVKSYDKISEYYRYYAKNEEEQELIDTLMHKYVKSSIVSDLVFSNTIQDMGADSLKSTGKSMFYRPFDNAFKTDEASNGKVHLTNTIPYEDWQSWHKDILLEAEVSTSSVRVAGFANIFERNYRGIDYAVSNGKYIEVIPTSAAVNPNITYTISNTLSGQLGEDGTVEKGAAYNIYVVFLPNVLKAPFNPKMNKVNFTLSYMDENGKNKNVTYNNNKEDYITSATEPTKVLVAENVVFPYAERGLKSPNVKLRISSSVASSLTATYTRELLIDCLIFEPAH